LTRVAGGTHIGPMPVVIHPATLAFDASGTPFSEKFADVYHSAQSGPDQARHVFLHGNDLPARWSGRRAFTIVETGFGIGLNFLATWAAWRVDSRRCERLHFVSVERHPFVRDDLAALHARHPEFNDISAAIRASWPPAIAGVHRLHLDGGQVTLTLVFDDALNALHGLRLGADAFYLDGFAPDRNPEMWSPAVMKALARLARPGATLATYTTARAVRDALVNAGFAVEKSKGLAPKRDMLTGHFAPRWTVRHPPPPIVEWAQKKALVIGAGLAGAAIAERLASRGWQVDILERGDDAARGASGLSAGVVQPHLSIDDCLLSRFTRAGFLYSYARRLEANDGTTAARAPHGAIASTDMRRASCGAIQVADDASHEARMADALGALAYPAEYAQTISRGDASARAGRAVAAGGWWIPMADWARPRTVVAASLAAASRSKSSAARAIFRREVAALRRIGDRWHAFDASGTEIDSAPVVVLANACDAMRLADIAPLPLQRVRGQLTIFPETSTAPRIVVCGRGYVLPQIDGDVVTGSSYDPDDASMQADGISHAGNLRRAERLLPGIAAGLDASLLRGEVGVRCVAPDRMPMVGAVVDMNRARDIADTLTGAHAVDLPRVPGLFCAIAFASRGLSWTALAAECLASQIEGEPLPLESTLVDAIDPGRFVVKYARRGMLR
jgi:tRNA 5-methylaminomethyl-2-thiouridine biosynthesis bifunctional protein